MYSLGFHHMGLLTSQPDLAANRLRSFGYIPGEAVFDPEQNVELRMCESPLGAAKIELVTPRETNLSLSRLLRRRDDYIYHLCFSTASIVKVVDEMSNDENSRVVELMPPKKAVLFGGRLVAFYLVSGLGLIELLEQPN